METTTETNQANRELTKTEIQIVIAQVQDRLMRVAKAQTELIKDIKLHWLQHPIDEEGERDEYPEEERKTKLRKKYDIPEGVHLFMDGVDSALLDSEAKACKPYIVAFVHGKLTKETLDHLFFFFDEVGECDYGWILVERPIGFYDAVSDENFEEIMTEIRSIGTRSRAKTKNLSKLTNLN
jgi:hypothetical protein